MVIIVVIIVVLVVIIVVVVSFGRCWSRGCVGEGGFGNKVLNDEVEGMDFFVADAEAVDDGFAAETGDFDEVLQ